jgi:hypothetical protein
MLRRRLIKLMAVLAAAWPCAAWACPMCAETVAADDHLPRAYMASILFMMGMPAILTSGFGIALYRMFKKQQALNVAAMAAQQHEEPSIGDASPDGCQVRDAKSFWFNRRDRDANVTSTR